MTRIAVRVPILTGFIAILSAAAVSASVAVVNTNADSGAGSLRTIVGAAANGDMITFDPALNGQTITLTSGEITINASITIQGPGAINLTVSGNGASRIFDVTVGRTVSISGLAFTKGADVGPTDGDGIGGAILDHGSLTVTSCTFTENTATGGTGSSGFANSGGSGDGGAIFVDVGATLHVDGCAFSFNVATGGTGGPSTSIAGSGGEAHGGAIFAAAGTTVTVTNNSSLSKNGATGGTGGNGGSGSSGLGGEGLGGAVYTLGTLNVSLSQFTDNSATGGTGGPGSDGDGGDGLGGALGISSGAVVEVTTSTLSGNAASGGSAGGGPFAGGGHGGAIFNGGEGNLTVTDSTFTLNQASGDCGSGGAIHQFGLPVSLVNDTFQGNSASCTGGALDVEAGLTLLNCTISGNTASSEGGGMFSASEGVTLTNTIVAGNTGATGPDGDVFSGTVQSGGHNVIGVAFNGSFTSGSGDQIGTSGSPLDPGLNALGANGGPTRTMSLQLTSPALDHGDDTQCPPTDQTTITTRPQGAHSDVGAFELPTTTGGGGNSFTLTVSVTGDGHVTSAPAAGIDCPSSCSAAYFSGTVITLTETPGPGAIFAGWGGACSGFFTTAQVTMNADQACTANFAPAHPIPTVHGPTLALLAGLLALGGGLFLRRP